MEVDMRSSRHLIIPKPTHGTYPTRLPQQQQQAHNQQQHVAWQKNTFVGNNSLATNGPIPLLTNDICNSDIAAAAFMWKCDRNGHGRTKRDVIESTLVIATGKVSVDSVQVSWKDLCDSSVCLGLCWVD
ncbi:unnamed protein product [Allacma fusca]|uniref:Uncharacterized protein n=1 Tax=Allacma fusca TaxID=39272 RepID=A0A8J2K1Z6_9HEXA|nr:unnamed protein product [Allacma fusca]